MATPKSSFLDKVLGRIGRLVFRAAADPQPRRGPGLESCCESDPVIEFERITCGYPEQELTTEQIVAFRATAEYARQHEFDAP